MFMHGGYMHIFSICLLCILLVGLESFGEVKVLFFYISCGLGAALMHTGINYYYFNDAINTLAANGFLREVLQLLNQGKINTQWQELLTVSQYQNFTSAYMGTVVGASVLFMVLLAFAFMFPMLN
jgi:membrane associated rhomboid family serine protease